MKEARRDDLMELQQEIAFEFGETLVGYELDVLIDAPGEQPGTYLGRTFADAPEIDGTVTVFGEGLKIGAFAPVVIVERDDYDLVGEAVQEESDVVAAR